MASRIYRRSISTSITDHLSVSLTSHRYLSLEWPSPWAACASRLESTSYASRRGACPRASGYHCHQRWLTAGCCAGRCCADWPLRDRRVAQASEAGGERPRRCALGGARGHSAPRGVARSQMRFPSATCCTRPPRLRSGRRTQRWHKSSSVVSPCPSAPAARTR